MWLLIHTIILVKPCCEGSWRFRSNPIKFIAISYRKKFTWISRCIHCASNILNNSNILVWIQHTTCMYIQSSVAKTQSNLQDTTIGTVMTATEIKSNFNIATDTPHLTLMGELWVSIVRIWEKIDRVNTASHVHNRQASARKTQLQCYRTGATSPHTNPSIYTCIQTAYVCIYIYLCVCVYMRLHIHQTQCKNDNSLHLLGPRKS